MASRHLGIEPTQGQRLKMIRRLDFTSIFLGALNIYRHSFRELSFLFLLLYLPLILFSAHFSMKFYQVWEKLSSTIGSGSEPPQDLLALFTSEEVIVLLASSIFLVVYFLIIYPLILIVPARLAGCLYLGKETSVWECVRFAWSKWWITQLSYSAFGILVIGCFAIPLLTSYLSFIPGLEIIGLLLALLSLVGISIFSMWLVILIAPLNGVISFEEARGYPVLKQAIRNVRRAFALSLSNFWRLLGILLVTWLLMLIIRYLVSQPIAIGLTITGVFLESKSLDLQALILASETVPTWVNATIQTIGIIVSTLTLPFEQLVIGLLYFELRSQREGLDILVNTALLTGEDVISAIATVAE